MTKQQFQILVVAHQALILGAIAVQYLTESTLPPELLTYLYNYQTILIADRISLMNLLDDIPFLIEISLGFLAAAGLLQFKGWGRTIFVVYIVTELILTLLRGPYVTTGWTALFGYISALAEGAILILVYCSSLRELFISTDDV